MKSPRYLGLAGLALPLLLPPVLAQDKSPPTPAPSAQAGKPAFPSITIQFPGGTLAKLVDALAKSPSGPVNIIGDERDLATEIPPFSLQNVHPQAFAQALNNLLESRGIMVVASGNASPPLQDVFTVRRTPPHSHFVSRDAFESIQLAPYLEHQSIDDIVSAIRTAWELDPAHEPSALRLKFHPATAILLISGPQEAINVAQKVVIGTLKRRPEKSAPADPKPAPPPDKK